MEKTIKTIKIPMGLTHDALMSLVFSIEDQFGCELIQICPDRAIFKYFD